MENVPDEAVIALEKTWRRRLFYLLKNRYGHVTDASEDKCMEIFTGKKLPFIFWEGGKVVD